MKSERAKMALFITALVVMVVSAASLGSVSFWKTISGEFVGIAGLYGSAVRQHAWRDRNQ
jgi:hypothetical protein